MDTRIVITISHDDDESLADEFWYYRIQYIDKSNVQWSAYKGEK
jgi:hypothetical protein